MLGTRDVLSNCRNVSHQSASWLSSRRRQHRIDIDRYRLRERGLESEIEEEHREDDQQTLENTEVEPDAQKDDEKRQVGDCSIGCQSAQTQVRSAAIRNNSTSSHRRHVVESVRRQSSFADRRRLKNIPHHSTDKVVSMVDRVDLRRVLQHREHAFYRIYGDDREFAIEI